jgi:large repetitive protein
LQEQAVTFTVEVNCPTARVETGTVTFVTGDVTLSAVTLNGQRAKITTSVLPKGTNQITATFSGTADIAGSAGSVKQTVD